MMEAQRQLVVDEARSWLGTPYRAGQAAKGVGVDCAWILLRVYTATGCVTAFDPGFYKGGLARLRAGEQFYRRVIERLCVPVVREARPGDIVLFRVPVVSGERVIIERATHGAIVEEWPHVIHAYSAAGAVVRSNIEHEPYLERQLDSLWSLPAWEA